MQQTKSVWFSPFMTHFKPLPRQTVLCRPTLNIPFTCLPRHHIHVFPCNSHVQLCCLDFRWAAASNLFQCWTKITVVFSNCCGTGYGEGVVGEECNCALDWLLRKSHSVVPPLPFFPTSSLPFLSSWQRVWVFERRKGIREPVFLISPYYLKTYMQLGTCTTSTFLLEEMNLCWYAKIRAWDSERIKLICSVGILLLQTIKWIATTYWLHMLLQSTLHVPSHFTFTKYYYLQFTVLETKALRSCLTSRHGIETYNQIVMTP